MDKVCGAIDPEGCALQFPENAAELGMQVWRNVGGDCGPSSLGTRDEMNQHVSDVWAIVSAAPAGLEKHFI